MQGWIVSGVKIQLWLSVIESVAHWAFALGYSGKKKKKTSFPNLLSSTIKSRLI